MNSHCTCHVLRCYEPVHLSTLYCVSRANVAPRPAWFLHVARPAKCQGQIASLLLLAIILTAYPPLPYTAGRL